ncbi:DUF948 domain-containing protein [bacterium]|nr:DUF948 domain-containing protein [bacterium]
MPYSVSIAIWVVVVVFAAIAFFFIRFLSQITKVGHESETALKTINAKLPPLIDRADQIMNKADLTVDRVNSTLDQIEVPLQYAKMLGQIVSESKSNISAKFGRSLMALLAGIKAGKAIVSSLRSHFSRGKTDDSLEQE